VLTALPALVAACGSDNPVPGPGDGTSIDLDVDARMTVDEAGFEPDHLDLVAGDVIELTNTGDEVHTFTSDSVSSGRLEPGETVTLAFPTAGEVEFHDESVPDHAGTVVVAEPGS
jgi:plastocyanin